MSYIIRQSANRNDLLIEREHRKGGTAVALIFMADDMRDTADAACLAYYGAKCWQN